MVAGHESCCRLAMLDAEHAELRTRTAVLKQQASAARADAESEREKLRVKAARLPARRWRCGRAATRRRRSTGRQCKASLLLCKAAAAEREP